MDQSTETTIRIKTSIPALPSERFDGCPIQRSRHAQVSQDGCIHSRFLTLWVYVDAIL